MYLLAQCQEVRKRCRYVGAIVNTDRSSCATATLKAITNTVVAVPMDFTTANRAAINDDAVD